MTLRRELRAANYDAVARFAGRNPVGGHRRAWLAAHAALAKPSRANGPRNGCLLSACVTRGAHVIEQDVELASAVAGDALDACRAVAARRSPRPKAGAMRGLRRHLPANARPVALIAPGAGWGAKRWPPERYAAGRAGTARARLAGAGQRWSRRRARWPQPSWLAAPQLPLTTTLPQLIALTRRIALCIAGDTGPLHLACALGRPVVGIYGPTDPSRNGPYGTRAKVLRSPGSRRDHKRRAAPDPGLLTIAPEDVLRAADELLAEERTG